MTVEIQLTKGYKTIVDDEDADLDDHKWYAAHAGRGRNNYAARYVPNVVKRIMFMHRVILSRILERELQTDELCDHINSNGLDNRRANLRVATRKQNNLNRGILKTNTTGYKNVKKVGDVFVVQMCNGKIVVSSFVNVIDAAKIADLLMARVYGEFANLNFSRPIKSHEIKTSRAIEAISDIYPICSLSKFIPRPMV